MTLQLLVSVRDSSEALAAVRGGADIIDVKDPSSGPLGFAGVSIIESILNVVHDQCPVSAALGECHDWLNSDVPNDDRLGRMLLPLPQEGTRHASQSANQSTGLVSNVGSDRHSLCHSMVSLSFVKMGLANLISCDAGRKWQQQWLDARQSVSDLIRSTDIASMQSSKMNEHATQRHSEFVSSKAKQYGHSEKETTLHAPAWVAVIYADHAQCEAPAPLDVVNAAEKTNCAGVLIDTFHKDGATTFHWLDVNTLQRIRSLAADAGLFFALAGQLGSQHLPMVKKISPDILAVRGAVCEGENRQSVVSERRVHELKTVLT